MAAFNKFQAHAEARVRYLVLVLLVGCAGALSEAEYAAALEDCLHRSTTCQEYVQCRAGVAEKFGRDFSGRCE